MRIALSAALAGVLGLFGASAAKAAGTPIAMTASEGYTCALASAGWVKCWGRNAKGELGNGTTASRDLPAKVLELRNRVIAIDAGKKHACVVLKTGTVKCWGWNDAGQLGDGTTTDRPIAVNVIGLNASIVSVAPQYYLTCALTSAGGVECWGGRYGSPQAPTYVPGLSSGITEIAAGGEHACALTDAGGVKCWGFNRWGQLGNGAWGTYYRDTPTDVVGLTSGVAAITAGQAHTCALMMSGGVKCWGKPDLLGHPGRRGRRPIDVLGVSGATSISAKHFHTCAVLQSGGVKCWGDNSHGELGDGTTTSQKYAVRVKGLEDISTVSAGFLHTCSLSRVNVMKCWGDNTYGQLGNGATGGNQLVPTSVKRF